MATTTGHTISGVRVPFKTLGVVFYRVARYFLVRGRRHTIAQFFDIRLEPNEHAGIEIETRIHAHLQRLSRADAGDFDTLKMSNLSCPRFERTVMAHSFFSIRLERNVFFGKHVSGQAKDVCKKRQSKPEPGSCLRPGAMCS